MTYHIILWYERGPLKSIAVAPIHFQDQSHRSRRQCAAIPVVLSNIIFYTTAVRSVKKRDTLSSEYRVIWGREPRTCRGYKILCCRVLCASNHATTLQQQYSYQTEKMFKVSITQQYLYLQILDSISIYIQRVFDNIKPKILTYFRVRLKRALYPKSGLVLGLKLPVAPKFHLVALQDLSVILSDIGTPVRTRTRSSMLTLGLFRRTHLVTHNA